ncbi:hypothetical protein BGZ83_000424 [Gryganskiella cystojenkinii]|nr:hypothetical protein BGZ83_000424 [Gryganskiella cystojenkinii]
MDLETLIPILISDEIQFPPRTSSSATSRTASPPSTPRPAKIKPLSIPTAPVPPSPTSKPVITAATIAASITSRPIAVESETRTGDSEETMPIPVPRQPQRPSLASRKSTDSFIQGSRVRLSMAHPPPPPPPTIPPPAIPKHDGLSCPNAALAALSARGRRSRTSAFLADRRSVSLDHLMDKTGSERKNMVWRERPSEDGGEEAPRWDSVSSLSSGMTSPRIRANSSPHFDFTPGAVNRCPRTNKIIPLPTSPPPPPALPPVPNPKSSRRLSHQRTENINLVNFSSGNSNNYWGGGGISPLSSISSPPMSPSLSGVGPVSPPLSPLTVQIPRSISRSFLRPESLTVTVSHPVIAARSSSANAVGAGADAGAASHLPIPTRVVKQQQQHQQLHQLQLQQLDLQMQRDRRWRSQSEPQQQQVTSPKETHRIVMPPSSSLFPSIPSPPVPQSYLLLRRPSQVLQEQAAAAAAAAQAAVNAQSNASYFSHSNDPFRMPRNGGGATPSPVFNKGRRPSATIMTSTITPGVGRMSSESYLSSTGTAHLKQRRSLSLDSAAAAIASSSAYVDATLTPASASPCCDGTSATQSQQNHERPLVVSSTSGSSTVKTADQELRAIIADAIAIAAAKSAAIEAARQSTWYRQNQHRYQQMYHQQAELLGSPSTFSSLSSPTSGPVNTSSGAGTSRPWTPNEDPWGGAPTNSTSSSRSASPFHSGGSST